MSLDVQTPRASGADRTAAGQPAVIGHRVAGRAETGGTRRAPVFNPADGKLIAEALLADRAQVERAVAAAKAAWPAWSDTPAPRRARVLFKLRDLIETNQAVLAASITREHGKVLGDARGEIARGLDVVDFACGIAQSLRGEISDNVGGGIDNWSLRQPLGVCAGITPFNFPAMVPLWMFPVAIVCGNTFVLKPSEKVPLSAVMLGDLLMQAGLPAGVFNIVHGDKECVDALLTPPLVRAVSFAGRFVDRLCGLASAMKVGPTDAGGDVDMGPLITREHLQRVTGYLDTGKQEGAAVALDGRRIDKKGDGFLIGPSVLDRVEPGM